jgi:hypothetical protein
MKVLAAIAPRIRRLVPTADGGLTAGLIAVLVAIELAGTQATSEFHDALAGAALVAAVIFALAWHRTRPLAWLSRLQSAGRGQLERFEQLKYDVGIDFRGTPPYPRGMPRLVPILFLTFAAAIALAFTAWHYFPLGWRDGGVKSVYVIYIALLMALWLSLFICMLLGVFIPIALLDHRIRSNAGDVTPGPPDAVVVAGYALVTLLVACVAPAAAGAIFAPLIAVCGLVTALTARPGDVEVLWRRHVGRGGVAAMPLRRVAGLAVMLFGLGLTALIAWACGSRLATATALESNMPLTAFLGAATAWLMPGLFAILALQWWEFRRSDPGRRQPLPVHLAGEPFMMAAGRIARMGFRVVPPGVPRKAEHVGLALVSKYESEALEFNPQWPLKVCLADLDGKVIPDRVARRDELQVRRRFFKALATLVKETKSLAPSRGGGFLIAPHYWFLGSVLWTDPERNPEEDGEALRPLGPPYRQVFDARVRQYLHRTLRALQIDAIYLEDGLGHRKLEKVLRNAFELHDIHGGRRRAEDHHFEGLPKVRVVIHDYAPGNPFALEDYPEPKFDDMTRSRILHVFKDRGEHEELVDAPFDFSWEPSPMLVG